jgi:hypothetical protein
MVKLKEEETKNERVKSRQENERKAEEVRMIYNLDTQNN